jgi:hypothetical protein
VDQFVLLANPSAQPAEVTLEYLRQAAQPILRTVTLAPNSRRTINVRFDEDGGFGGQFGTTRHGLAITATQPIAAERSMYIANSAGTWIAGHNTVGAPTLANVWALPEGASFGFLRTDVLVANPTNSTIAIQVIYLLESGSEVRRNYNIAPKQRITLHGSDEVAVRDRAYSTVILSKTGNFVAERSSYFNALGAEIGGATCSLGIALQLDLSTKEAEEAALEILRPIGAPESVLERRAIPTPTVTPRPTPTPRVP